MKPLARMVALARLFVGLVVGGLMFAEDRSKSGLESGPEEPLIRWPDPEVTRSRGLVLYRGAPWTGLLEKWNREEVLVARERYVEGQRSGKWERWHGNGNRESLRQYGENRKHGTHSGWYPSGQIKFRIGYDRGNYHGERIEWHPSGRVAARFRYHQGAEVGLQRVWDLSGNLQANYVTRDGRRYGLVGVKPCVSVPNLGEALREEPKVSVSPSPKTAQREASSSLGQEPRLPYYLESTLTPVWVERNEPMGSDLHRVGAFELINQNGEGVSEKALAGRIRVVRFFFTSCSGICATMTKNLKRIQDEFLTDPEVRLISFSVLPEVDTVSILKDYARDYGVVSGKWDLLTGSRQQVYRLAESSYFAEAGGSGNQPDEEILHSEKVFLVDGQGRIRGVYNGTLAFDMRRLIEDVLILKREPQTRQDS